MSLLQGWATPLRCLDKLNCRNRCYLYSRLGADINAGTWQNRLNPVAPMDIAKRRVEFPTTAEIPEPGAQDRSTTPMSRAQRVTDQGDYA